MNLLLEHPSRDKEPHWCFHEQHFVYIENTGTDLAVPPVGCILNSLVCHNPTKCRSESQVATHKAIVLRRVCRQQQRRAFNACAAVYCAWYGVFVGYPPAAPAPQLATNGI